jgi:rfaE bifunctional protein kinase chain/domain
VLNERFVGGAGIVAGHASGLGATTRLVTVMGDDDIAAFTLERLASYGIETHCVTDESRPTTLKQRYRSGGNTLLRVSHLKQHEIEQDLQQRFFEIVVDHLEDTDLLIFSDFNYGCLPLALVEMIVTEGRRRGVFMVADSQSSSQVGDIARFRGMRLLTPTEREARLALRDFNSGLVVLADMLCEKADAENVILTMGPEGLLVYSRRRDAQGLATDQLPALNSRPKDTAGAGDSLLIVASMALAAGADIWQSSYLGSLASACQVGRTGNIPLTVSDLLREIGD